MAKSKLVIELPHHADIIRALIESTRGAYGSVVFVKKDRTLRKLTFQRGNDEAYILGTERGEKASASFHANPDNANLMRLRDTKLYREGNARPWRTVNLETVQAMRVNGQSYRFVQTHNG